jgi:biotin operon repressor
MVHLIIYFRDTFISNSDRIITMLTSLFSSRIRAKVIAAIFLSPGKKHNAWELAQKLNVTYSAVWKELGHLEELGVLRIPVKSISESGRCRSPRPVMPITCSGAWRSPVRGEMAG